MYKLSLFLSYFHYMSSGKNSSLTAPEQLHAIVLSQILIFSSTGSIGPRREMWIYLIPVAKASNS
jgi:hypothetical protein